MKALLLSTLLLLATAAWGTAYYSSAAPTVATPSACGVPINCGGVQVATAAQLAGLTLAANVYAATNGPVTLRLPLGGTAPSGYRAGFLVSNLGTAVSLQTLGTVTLRTYLSGILQQSSLVDASVLQAALLTSTGDPAQLEFVTAKPFDAVELELGSALALGGGIRVRYAYGIEPTSNREVSGYASRFSSTTGQYDSSGCPTGINNAARAVDTDLTNYATFASLITVGCTEKLQVNLEGTAPTGYLAGFVVGGANNLLNADLLGGLTLRTYRNGVEQQMASGTALLSLDLLPSGQQFVRFSTNKPFDAVSIERTGAVTALDNLQLYYGAGLANTPPTQARSTWDNPAGHYQITYNSAICALCTVLNPGNAADNNLGNKATIQVGAGVANSVSLRLELNGGGVAGNRAGVLIGRSSMLDVSALSRIVVRTYDANSNVLESRSGASLLTVNTLADGRQTVSFNSTRDFASVGVTVSGVAGLLDTSDVYYAFADDSNGAYSIVLPTPLPVQLVAFTAQAEGSCALLTWRTASEVNSDFFVVERSTDGRAFTALQTVAAAGTSTTPRTYTARDAQAVTLGVPQLYYRLQSVDRDGTSAYSPVQVVALTPVAAGLTAFPNPATRTARLTGAPASGRIQVLDALGRIVTTATADANGEAGLSLPAGLCSGVYIVRVGSQALRLLVN